MAISKRKIAINSVWLFIRMGFTIIVSLYTSRVILGALGASDFGIYNVVAGVITMFAFFSGSLSQSVQRYTNFFLAKGDVDSMIKVFSSAYFLVFALAVIIVVMGETLGLWFLNAQLKIPTDRILAANWIYQFTVISAVITLLAVPLQGLVTAHEHFSKYAKMSMLDVLFKLLIAYCVSIVNTDKLILYGFLVCIAHVYLPTALLVHCKRNYVECSFSFSIDKAILKDVSTFSGWNLLGSSANICSTQGINMVLNIFFGPLLNASRGIAFQVSQQVDNLINNVQIAMNPQIQQLYSKNDHIGFMSLIIDNFKWNFMLYWIVALPLLMRTDYVVRLWLGDAIPDYTILFIQISLIRCLLKCFERPLNTCLFACGNMKWVNICASLVLLGEVVAALFLFKLGFPPYWCFLLDLIAVFIVVLQNSFFSRAYTHFKLMVMAKDVMQPIIMAISVSLFVTSFINEYLDNSFVSFVNIVTASFIVNITTYYMLLLSKAQKAKLITNLRFIINRKIK